MSLIEPICVSCTGPLHDLTGIAQLKKIERMISDNYTIIFICIIILFILGLILWYFSSELKNTLYAYRKAYIKLNENLAINVSAGVDDAEIYDNDGEYIDTNKYFEAGKLDFVAKMKVAYKDYNKQKADYIKNTYSSLDDDAIDTTAMYSKHDDYEYIKKDA